MRESNKFNIAESEHYLKNKDLSEKTSEKKYKEDWENQKTEYSGLAVTREMERSKELTDLRVKYKNYKCFIIIIKNFHVQT